MLTKKGYTIIELIVVLSLLAVLSVILTLSMHHVILINQENVCRQNRLRIGQFYTLDLQQNQINHSDLYFNLWLHDHDICPNRGIVHYEGGEVICSLHSRTNHAPDPSESIEETVPYLYEHSFFLTGLILRQIHFDLLSYSGCRLRVGIM